VDVIITFEMSEILMKFKTPANFNIHTSESQLQTARLSIKSGYRIKCDVMIILLCPNLCIIKL